MYAMYDAYATYAKYGSGDNGLCVVRDSGCMPGLKCSRAGFQYRPRLLGRNRRGLKKGENKMPVFVF